MTLGIMEAITEDIGEAGTTHGITAVTGEDGMTLGITADIGADTHGTDITTLTIADGTEDGTLFGDITTTALSTAEAAQETAGTDRDMRHRETAGYSQAGQQRAAA